jgi:hypothetical protein
MPRDPGTLPPDSLQALLERYRVRELKPLAGLLASSLPTRKAELIALIAEHVRDAHRLRRLWDTLDELQQAAVAETLHGLWETWNRPARIRYVSCRPTKR